MTLRFADLFQVTDICGYLFYLIPETRGSWSPILQVYFASYRQRQTKNLIRRVWFQVPGLHHSAPFWPDWKLPFWGSVQFSSVAQWCQTLVTPWTAAHQASLSITNSQNLLKLMSIELVMPSNHFILCCPFYFLPSVFPSIRVFSNESVLGIMRPKYWNFSFSISPSSEYLGLISFKINWLDLLTVQGTQTRF